MKISGLEVGKVTISKQYNVQVKTKEKTYNKCIVIAPYGEVYRPPVGTQVLLAQMVDGQVFLLGCVVPFSSQQVGAGETIITNTGNRRFTGGGATATSDWTFPGGSTSLLHSP